MGGVGGGRLDAAAVTVTLHDLEAVVGVYVTGKLVGNSAGRVFGSANCGGTRDHGRRFLSITAVQGLCSF